MAINKSTQRDNAIDILRFFAVLLITWSHFDAPLGKYGYLATGGGLGDSLFFFMSGFTLLLSNRKLSFFNWYKRRINRIYPTVFAWALMSMILFNNNQDMVHILLYGGGFFVTCIMVFYLLFYPIKKFIPIRYWSIVIIALFLAQGIAYFVVDHSNYQTHYIWTWSSYFISMLLGAIIGKRSKENETLFLFHSSKMAIIIGLAISIVGYYLLMYLGQTIPMLAIFNIIPLAGFSYFFYCMCCSQRIKRIFQLPWANWIGRAIGALCLEVYIVQPSIITDKLNNLFPLNLLILFAVIIFAAYILHCLANLWTQTFKDADYNWKEIIKPF